MAGAKRGAPALALGVATVLLASGCGGGKKNSTPPASTTTPAPVTTTAAATPLAKGAYVAKMQAIGKSLSTSLSTLTSATTATKAATALVAVQSDLRAAAARLEAIHPPAAIAKQHAQLVQAVRDFADELDPVIAKLKGGSLAAMSTLQNLKGLQEIQTASTAISTAGYKIGG